MACQVPVVVTDVSDNARVVPDGVVGYVVPPGDAVSLADRIGRLVASPQERRAMGREGRRWVTSEFSLSRMAANMGDVYREALRAGIGTAVEGQ